MQSGVFGNTLMENHNTGPWRLEQDGDSFSIEICAYMLFRNSLLIESPVMLGHGAPSDQMSGTELGSDRHAGHNLDGARTYQIENRNFHGCSHHLPNTILGPSRTRGMSNAYQCPFFIQVVAPWEISEDQLKEDEVL